MLLDFAPAVAVELLLKYYACLGTYVRRTPPKFVSLQPKNDAYVSIALSFTKNRLKQETRIIFYYVLPSVDLKLYKTNISIFRKRY